LSSQNDISSTAEIVDLVGLIKKSKRRGQAKPANYPATASLLSMRQNLNYQATVGVDDIAKLSTPELKSELLRVNELLRRLLNKEFGSKRVHKHRQVFTVGHHCLDTLVEGLLHVQFHAKQLDAAQLLDDSYAENTGLRVTWGVGNSIREAESQRSRRQASKRF